MLGEMKKTKVGIIGTGMIGASLAVLFTGNGYETTMLARTDKGYESGLELYKTYYNDLVMDKLITKEQAGVCAEYLYFTKEYSDLKDMDCIFESVLEDLNAKKTVYGLIEEHAPNIRAVASATSSIPPDTLIDNMILSDRFLVAHPFNPPHMIPCFEIIRGSSTKDGAVDFICELLREVGREPVLVKSAPGFIVNRIQQAMYREAVYMVESGISTPEDIDRALQYSVAPRYTSIGLFEHFDGSGLDVGKKVNDSIYPTLCNAIKAQDMIEKHYNAGEYGLKTGQGVLDWRKKDIEDFRRRCSYPYYKYFNWKLPKS